MATTTPNFGWSVPTSTDLVKDGATAIETLGDAIDASLVDLKGGTTGQVLAKASNTDMDFVWSADSQGMTNPMTTTGDTIYSSSGSTPARLAIGSTGQVLTVSGGVPTWANAPGKVLQVVYASYSTSTTSTSTTYTDSGLSATITPSKTSSKVMILTTQTLSVDRSAGGQYSRLKLLRGATDILTIGGGTYQQMFGMEVYATGTTYLEIDGVVPVNYLDSPSTTSATTYKTQFACGQQPGGPTVTTIAQRNSATSTMILLEIGA